MFERIPKASVITRSNGVFKASDIFALDSELFCSHGTGYLRLLDKGATSHYNIMWSRLKMDVPYTIGILGRLTLEGVQ
jgi:hypothetical protein